MASGGFRPVPVLDGHKLRYGNRLQGPAIVEQRNTTLFVSTDYNLEVDGEVNSDAAWSYPDPSDAAKNIKDHFAFWKGVELS